MANLLNRSFLALVSSMTTTVWTFHAAAEPAISDCGGPARVDAIVEPWNEATRTFANGKIRIIALDTAEPACCSFHLAIIAPDPENELGLRQCVALNDGSEWTGFQYVDVQGTESSYDPSRGLLLSVPVERYIDGTRSTKLVVDVRINQATGAITIE